MRGFFLSLSFLTVFPLLGRHEASGRDMGRSAAFFPLAGGVIGVFLVAVLYLSGLLFDADVVSALVVLSLAAITGGLHLDGLSDTFDAIGKRGSAEDKLRVMKDPSSGPLGVSAVVIVLLLKFVGIKSMIGLAGELRYAFLFLLPVITRWAMVPAMYHASSARKEGLGNSFIVNIGLRELAVSTLIAGGIFIGVFVFAGEGTRAVPLLMLVLYILGILFARAFGRLFGGITGDTVGAFAEVSEIVYILGALIWLHYYSS